MRKFIQTIAKHSNVFIILFIFVYTFAAIIVSVNRYWQYQNYYLDFGIFDSAIWKVSRFQLPLVDHVDYGYNNIIIFANHFNPSIFLFSPLYWITSKSEVLLIAQAGCVGIGAYIAFLIANEKIKNKLAVFSLVFAFLGYVGLQNALISDFHDATVLVLPLMILFWAFLKEKWKTYFLALIVILGFKESFAGLGVALSIFVIITDKKYWKISVVTFIISLLWGLLAIKYVIPYFAGGYYFFTPKSLPTNLTQLASSFFLPVLKVKTIFFTFLTFIFLPLFNLPSLFLIFENFFERYVLSDGRGIDLGMHYNAPLAPIMFMGSYFVLVWLQKQNRVKIIISPLAIFMFLTVLVLHRVILHGPMGLSYNPVFFEQNARVQYVDDFLTKIPNTGLIMTQNDLATRFTHRNVKLLRLDYLRLDPDVVALNLTPGQNPNSFFPLDFDKTRQLKDRLISDPDYDLVKYGDEVYLFTKIK